MTQVAGGGVRGRGRPPRLSREQIVDTAVALVRADPSVPLTVKRVAEAVGSAPMALYRYFPDRDDLLHAVADQVAADMSFGLPEGGSWQERLRAWMVLSVRHLQPYPQLLPYIAATSDPAWLPFFVLLVDLLEPAGLSDPDLALAVTLIGGTIVGQALLEARRRPAAEVVQAMCEVLRSPGTTGQRRVSAVLTHVPAAYGRVYPAMIDGVVATVEGLAQR
jgi:AcrR family transcriptional regulator